MNKNRVFANPAVGQFFDSNTEYLWHISNALFCYYLSYFLWVTVIKRSTVQKKKCSLLKHHTLSSIFSTLNFTIDNARLYKNSKLYTVNVNKNRFFKHVVFVLKKHMWISYYSFSFFTGKNIRCVFETSRKYTWIYCKLCLR